MFIICIYFHFEIVVALYLIKFTFLTRFFKIQFRYYCTLVKFEYLRKVRKGVGVLMSLKKFKINNLRVVVYVVGKSVRIACES